METVVRGHVRDRGNHSHATMAAGEPGGRKKRAARRLALRTHGREKCLGTKNCGCARWDPDDGFRAPGSTSGRK